MFVTRRILSTALIAALAACGGGGGGGVDHHVSGKELKNLDKQVQAKFKDAAWESHIKKIHKGLLGISINTDYDVLQKGVPDTLLAICNAYVKTSATSPFIKVYGRRKHEETKIDGSKKTRTTDEWVASTEPAGFLSQPGDPDYGDENYKDKCEVLPSYKTASTDSTAGMPADEAKFVQAFLDADTARQRDLSGASDDKITRTRDAAICAALPKNLTVSNWLGKVGAGSGPLLTVHAVVLSVDVAKLDTLTTAHGSISDEYNTLISKVDPTYAVASTLKIDDRVRFSGHFFKDSVAPERCLDESSLTDTGHLVSPDWTFAFTSVEKL